MWLATSGAGIDVKVPSSRLVAVLAAALWLAGSVLGVSGAANAAPGDNGDVKIHASGTPVDDERDEPKACVFYLDAFHFDGVQQVTWHIDQQPPTGTSQVSQGTITLDPDGHGYTSDMTLPPGHYKLFWTWAGQRGASKSTVFTVDCASPTPRSFSPSTGPSTSVSPSASGSAGPGPSSSASGAAPVSPAPGTSGPAGGGGALPDTGPPVTALIAVAGVLVGVGALLRTWVRRRKAWPDT
ncbi:MAG TPA: hypothetical protein VGN37_25970 [Actinocatenispora sp.]